jgi:hypothetical protein
LAVTIFIYFLYFQLTNLLLFGADPLLECEDGEEKFANIFVYAKKIIKDMETGQSKPASNPAPSQL